MMGVVPEPQNETAAMASKKLPGSDDGASDLAVNKTVGASVMLWILLFILLIVLIIVGATAVMMGQDQGGDASGYPSREIYRRQHVHHVRHVL